LYGCGFLELGRTLLRISRFQASIHGKYPVITVGVPMVKALSIHIQVDCLLRRPQLPLLVLERHPAVVQNLVLDQPNRRRGLENVGPQVDSLIILLVNPRRPFLLRPPVPGSCATLKLLQRLSRSQRPRATHSFGLSGPFLARSGLSKPRGLASSRCPRRSSQTLSHDRDERSTPAL